MKTAAVHIALLRAVNLAGLNKVGMSDLRELLEKLGMEEVRTLLQSGNAVFRTASASSAALEPRLEREFARRLGFNTDFFIRSAAQWKALIAANPFPKQASADPGHLLVLLLKDEPSGAALSALRGAINGREIVELNGREAYVVYPDGVGRSKLTIALIERKLGTRATGRNWNTVVKLAALAGI